MDLERWMDEALRLAREAGEAGEVPVGCVVVRDGEILGRGRNRREEERSALAHALKSSPSWNASSSGSDLASRYSKVNPLAPQ